MSFGVDVNSEGNQPGSHVERNLSLSPQANVLILEAMLSDTMYIPSRFPWWKEPGTPPLSGSPKA